MDLPEDLRVALDSTLKTVPPRSLAPLAEDLSQRYRSRHAQHQPMSLRSKEESIAYAAYRLPATFAAIHAALIEVRKRKPQWQPRTLLDVGAGPGTAMWAVASVWPELEHVTLLDRNQHMIAYGKALAAHASTSAVHCLVPRACPSWGVSCDTHKSGVGIFTWSSARQKDSNIPSRHAVSATRSARPRTYAGVKPSQRYYQSRYGHALPCYVVTAFVDLPASLLS